MTPAQLKAELEAEGSNFFSRDTMRMFGDTMRNYRVTGPVEFETFSGDVVACWALERKSPVGSGPYKLTATAFFCCETFQRRYPKRGAK